MTNKRVATVLSPAHRPSPFFSLKGPHEMFLTPLAGEALRAPRSDLLEGTQTHSHRQTGPDPGLSEFINHHSGCGGPVDRLPHWTEQST